MLIGHIISIISLIVSDGRECLYHSSPYSSLHQLLLYPRITAHVDDRVADTIRIVQRHQDHQQLVGNVQPKGSLQ